MDSAVPLAELVAALRHDVVRASVSGDDTRGVLGVELLDLHAGEADGPGQLLLGVGLDADDEAAVDSALRITGDSRGVLAVKCDGALPAEFPDLARRADVPVVSIESGVPWSRVQRLVSSLLATRLGGDAGGPEAGGDLFALANSVAAVAGGAVAIMDTSQAIVAYSNLPDQPIDETRRSGILGRRVPEEALPDHLADEVWSSDSVVQHQRENALPRLAVVIRAGEEVLGSLWVAFPARKVAPDCEATLQQAARLAALHMLALRRHVDADQENRNIAFRAALDQPHAGTADLRLPGVLLGVDLPQPDDRHGANLLRILDLFGVDGRALGHLPALMLSHDRIYGLLPIARPGAVPVDALVAHVLGRVERTLDLKLTIVSSGEIHTTADLHRERPDVDTALDHVQDSTMPPGHYSTERLRTAIVHTRLTNAVRADPRLRTGQGEHITDHDQNHATAFANTLLAYLRHFGDIAAVGTDLHIHQNTVRQRLRRAQDLFALDLTDPAQRLVLELELTAAASGR